MVSRSKEVTDYHVCESGTSLQGKQNYSNSRVRGYGLLGKLSLIIRQLELHTSKTHQDKCECYGVLYRGEVEKGTIVVFLVGECSGLVYASYLKSGTRSSGLAKSKLALLQLNPTSL